MKFLMIRHSIKDREAEAFMGFDAPLTEEGFEYAHKLGEELRERGFRNIFAISSPSIRCIQTAASILSGAGIRKDFDEIPTPYELKTGFVAAEYLGTGVSKGLSRTSSYLDWMKRNKELVIPYKDDPAREYTEYLLNVIRRYYDEYDGRENDLFLVISHDFVIGSLIESLSNGALRKPIPYYLNGVYYTSGDYELWSIFEIWGKLGGEFIDTSKSPFEILENY